MAKPHPPFAEPKSATAWLIDHLSKKWAGLTGARKELLEVAMKEALSSGSLPTTTWVIERTDGTQLPEEIIERPNFLVWFTESFFWSDNAPPLTGRELAEELWPPELFEDNVPSKIGDLLRRWAAQTGSHSPAFTRGLELAELGVFTWQNKKRSIHRGDFVTWFEASKFVHTINAVSEISRTLTADDLWPRPADRRSTTAGGSVKSQHMQHLGKEEAATLAIKERFPEDLPNQLTKKMPFELNNYIAEHGGPSSISPRTYRRALALMKDRQTARPLPSRRKSAR